MRALASPGWMKESNVGDRIPGLFEGILGERSHLGLNEGIRETSVTRSIKRLDEGILAPPEAPPDWMKESAVGDRTDGLNEGMDSARAYPWPE